MKVNETESLTLKFCDILYTGTQPTSQVTRNGQLQHFREHSKVDRKIDARGKLQIELEETQIKCANRS